MREEDIFPTRLEAVDVDTELKKLIVNYVGEAQESQDENITVDMIVEMFASEFPDFLLAVAEENFIRGYEQALVDVSVVETDMCEEETPES